ncbi:hypothetical protein SAMN05216421_2315 [Halopseudomonas xinjiangensis]|uniref:Uncharacterized protein n=1 Tax=Halopseudomonas xinjiangensis TaxID=487184 RepID=A0A1H1VJ65_9GAMM|nr:hypothetical protein SAMN05216421_2315 [Halopseudomonas xinjiangensis]
MSGLTDSGKTLDGLCRRSDNGRLQRNIDMVHVPHDGYRNPLGNIAEHITETVRIEHRVFAFDDPIAQTRCRMYSSLNS